LREKRSGGQLGDGSMRRNSNVSSSTFHMHRPCKDRLTTSNSSAVWSDLQPVVGPASQLCQITIPAHQLQHLVTALRITHRVSTRRVRLQPAPSCHSC
jgi:hypothetical protein